MFAPKEKPLPVAVLKPEPAKNTRLLEDAGIHLGEGYYWNPEALPNGQIVAIGASGSGKTQTLKAIAKYLVKQLLKVCLSWSINQLTPRRSLL